MNGWVSHWTDKDGHTLGRRPVNWTDTDERELAVFLRSKRLVGRIEGADVAQYHERMNRHIDQLMDRVAGRTGGD